MREFFQKSLAGVLSLMVFSSTLFAQENKVEQLRIVRANYVALSSAMPQKTQKDKKIITNLLITIGIPGALAGGLVLIKEASYRLSKMSAKKTSALTSVDLYAAQSKLWAQMPKGQTYMASQLGEEMMPVMQQLFERWKETHIYEIKNVIAESAERAFQVTPGLEKEFVERVSALYEDFMAKAVLDGNTLLVSGENGITSYTKALQEQFEKTLTAEMRAGRSLYAYVNPVRAKAGQTALKRAVGTGGVKSLGKVGKMVFKKSLPLVAVGLFLGVSSAHANDAEILSRIDANPILLLDVDDQTFEAVLHSPALVERSLEVYDTWERVNELTAEQSLALLQEAEKEEHKIKALRQQQVQDVLKSVGSY